MTIFQYLDKLQVLVEDEILLLKYEPDFQDISFAFEIRKQWNKDRNLENFNRWLGDKFKTLVPQFVSDVDEVSNDAFDETLLLKFFTLTNIILGTKHFHYSNKKLDEEMFGQPIFGRTDHLIYASVRLLVRTELPKFLDGLVGLMIPEFIESWVSGIKIKVEKFLEFPNLKKIDQIMDKIYQIYEVVLDFIEFLDDTEFELEETEVDGLNQILSSILYLHGILYNFLLVTEKLVDLEEQDQNLLLMETKEILEEHDTRLEMFRMLSNELKN